jgi:hypothetical protein
MDFSLNGSRGSFASLASPVFTNISVLFPTEIYGICLNFWLSHNLAKRRKRALVAKVMKAAWKLDNRQAFFYYFNNRLAPI